MFKLRGIKTASFAGLVALAIFAVASFAMNNAAQAVDAGAAVKAKVGEAAPDFTLTDIYGQTHSLSDFKGKPVILEWTNHQCPYVKKFYEGGDMQGFQQQAVDSGAVWLTIVSSAEGEQGYVTQDEGKEIFESQGFKASALLRDVDGQVGQSYNALTTPHMYVIDAEGTLVYAGAIDDRPSTNPKTIEGATNYVQAALSNLANGEAVAVTSTQPYGCGVKYKRY